MDLRKTLLTNKENQSYDITRQSLIFKTLVADISGEKIFVHPEDHISHVIQSNRYYYEFEIFDKFWDYIPNKGTFLDIGSNIGNHALMFNRFRPEVKIHCFEPVFNNFVLLNHNTKDIDKIQIYNIGLGDTNELLSIEIPKNNAGGARIVNDNINTQKVIILKGDMLNIKDVSFIKIDVEGFEYKTLRGLERTILETKPSIWLEDFDGVASKYLESIGYVLVESASFGNKLMTHRSN